jgi:orotate phosphoribosyltransferase
LDTQKNVLATLERYGAVITDSHIVYTSGKHGSAYINKDAVYPYPHIISHLCELIAEYFASYHVEVEIVVAPAVGGVILSNRIAEHLYSLTNFRVLGVYAEKSEDNETFIIKRGYDKLIPGRRVLVVEDVLTTGGSVKKVVEAVRNLGGEVVGVGAICNRGGVKPEDIGNVPKLFSLVNVNLDAWDEAECPLCKQGVPINTEVGRGREYLAKKGKI